MSKTRGQAALLEQIACASTTVDSSTLERVRHEVLTVPTDWVISYNQYQSGGWATLSLLNQTGDPCDVTIADAAPVATSLLEQMPATRALLDQLGLDCMWVRLARLSADSYLWEHRDYDELASVERHRVHIPIVTSGSAVLAIAGSAVHLGPGRIWRLTPTFVHGACNIFGPPRIHLILDCYASD